MISKGYTTIYGWFKGVAMANKAWLVCIYAQYNYNFTRFYVLLF